LTKNENFSQKMKNLLKNDDKFYNLNF
jgi:hypothetical protein